MNCGVAVFRRNFHISRFLVQVGTNRSDNTRCDVKTTSREKRALLTSRLAELLSLWVDALLPSQVQIQAEVARPFFSNNCLTLPSPRSKVCILIWATEENVVSAKHALSQIGQREILTVGGDNCMAVHNAAWNCALSEQAWPSGHVAICWLQLTFSRCRPFQKNFVKTQRSQ